jgi:hypothetical protein
MTTLQEVVETLPSFRNPPNLVGEYPRVRHPDAEDPLFVAPSLILQQPEGHPSVVLISAPAAIGKTMLAGELARLIDGPLWDLAQFRVGSNFIEGTLLKSYGAVEAGRVLTQLANGDACIVLDALDEAGVRAGTSGFDEFMHDLCAATSAPRPRPAFVVLARADTADLIAMYLEEEPVPYARYSIDFFDKNAAKEVIRRRLDKAHAEQSAPHRDHAAAFEAAMTQLLDLVVAALSPRTNDPWAEEHIRSFVGYPPVLAAIATFLDVPNFGALQSELREERFLRWSGDSAAWRMLNEIIEGLLRREQGKLVSNVRPRMEPGAQSHGWDAWESLYQPPEQRSRLLHWVLGEPLQHALPSDLSGPLRDPYEDAVTAMLPEHPFRGEQERFANVVFREYLFAYGLVEGDAITRSKLRDRLHSDGYLPTPLLARFLLNATEADGESLVEAQDFGILYDSLTSEARQEGEVSVFVWNDAADEDAHALIIVGDRSEVAFLVTDVEHGISIGRSLSQSVIDVASDLRLEHRNARLGPNVQIECSTFRLRAMELQVLAEVDGDVLIMAESYDDGGSPPRLRVHELRVHGKGLRVYWQNVRYPWVNYKIDEVAEEVSDASLASALVDLSRILRLFSRRYYLGEIGAHRTAVDRMGVGGTAQARDLLDYMLQSGLLIEDAARKSYFVDPKAMSRFGINWNDVRARQLSPAIKDYLTAFLESGRSN